MKAINYVPAASGRLTKMELQVLLGAFPNISRSSRKHLGGFHNPSRASQVLLGASHKTSGSPRSAWEPPRSLSETPAGTCMGCPRQPSRTLTETCDVAPKTLQDARSNLWGIDLPRLQQSNCKRRPRAVLVRPWARRRMSGELLCAPKLPLGAFMSLRWPNTPLGAGELMRIRGLCPPPRMSALGPSLPQF